MQAKSAEKQNFERLLSGQDPISIGHIRSDLEVIGGHSKKLPDRVINVKKNNDRNQNQRQIVEQRLFPEINVNNIILNCGLFIQCG